MEDIKNYWNGLSKEEKFEEIMATICFYAGVFLAIGLMRIL